VFATVHYKCAKKYCLIRLTQKFISETVSCSYGRCTCKTDSLSKVSCLLNMLQEWPVTYQLENQHSASTALHLALRDSSFQSLTADGTLVHYFYPKILQNITANISISNKLYDVRFEVFTAVTTQNGVFWDVTSCGSCKNRRFGGT
jgi:hypothetical protein